MQCSKQEPLKRKRELLLGADAVGCGPPSFEEAAGGGALPDCWNLAGPHGGASLGDRTSLGAVISLTLLTLLILLCYSYKGEHPLREKIITLGDRSNCGLVV